MYLSGSTKGIGRAILLELATRGASILGTYTTSSSSYLFDELSVIISSLYSTTTSTHHVSSAAPKLVGIAADITASSSPSTIIGALGEHFGGKVDIVVFNAAVMGLAKMGEGTINSTWVDQAMAGAQPPSIESICLSSGRENDVPLCVSPNF